VQAAHDLARRLSPSAAFTIAVLPEGLTLPTTLADGTVLLPYQLLEAVDGPDTLAGIILAQRAATSQFDPLLTALRHAGLIATLRLMSSGVLPAGALAGYGIALAEQDALTPNMAVLNAAFADLQITSAPFGGYLNLADFSALPDPAPNGSNPPVLDDSAFLGLQYICDG
jgi:hypothetical protein